MCDKKDAVDINRYAIDYEHMKAQHLSKQIQDFAKTQHSYYGASKADIDWIAEIRKAQHMLSERFERKFILGIHPHTQTHTLGLSDMFSGIYTHTLQDLIHSKVSPRIFELIRKHLVDKSVYQLQQSLKAAHFIHDISIKRVKNLNDESGITCAGLNCNNCSFKSSSVSCSTLTSKDVRDYYNRIERQMGMRVVITKLAESLEETEFKINLKPNKETKSKEYVMNQLVVAVARDVELQESHLNFKTNIKDLKEGDVVVVNMSECLHVVGYVVGYVNTDKTHCKASRWVVCKISLTAYEKAIQREENIRILKSKLKARHREMEEITIYKLLAKDDSKTAEMLKELEKLETF